ncbi:MAG: tetratricopeptide repeat protein, partial [Acidobacteria bacterium]|nr:tetratricopeptide repeat protein [Acidobacteriota bacterium]
MIPFRRKRPTLRPFCLARPPAAAALVWIPVLLVVWGAASLHLAGSFLSPRVLSGDDSRYQFQTFAGAQVVTAAPLQLPARISVLVLPRSYSDRVWQEVELRARQLAILEGRLGRFRLHVVADGRVSSWETSAQALPHDLAGLRSGSESLADDGTEPPARRDERAVGLYQEAGQHLPAPSVPWETLILIAPDSKIADEELKSYCSAYLADRFGRQQVRLVYWEVPGDPAPASPTAAETSEPGGASEEADSGDGIWATVARSTCGSVIETVGELTQALLPASCTEIPMPEVALPKGVVQYRARLVDRADGQIVTEFPALSRSLDGGTVLPGDFARLLQALRNARQAAAQRNGETLQASLREALDLNPFHPPTLRFAAEVYRRQGELRTALQLMTPLASLMPRNASIFTEIGDLHFDLQEWEQSEQSYRRAMNADPGGSAVLAKLIGIREAQGEIARGLQEIGTALRRFPEGAFLHARRGSLLEKSGRAEEALKAYGRAVELRPELGEGHLGLARIHLARDRKDKAREVLQEAAGKISDAPGLPMRFAGFCEKESLDEQALDFYRKALNADPGLPGAYLGLARVQMNLGEIDEALAAAHQGLQFAPRSVELHQFQVDLLKQSDRIPEMRRAVEDAAATFPGNVEVLAKLARVRDVFGYRAAEAYERLAEALEAEKAGSDRLEPVLERGLLVALRDGDRARAARMSARLKQLGRGDIPAIDPIAGTTSKQGLLVVPGGVRGLARAAGLRENTPPETFVSDFISHLIRRTYGKAGAGYVQALRYYFDSVAALRSRARSKKLEFQILLETGNESRLRKTREVLALLGWTIKRSEGRIRVALGTDELAALRQTFSSALGVDEMEMKSQLEAGASYRLTFSDQAVPIIFEERFWLRRFFEGNRPVGGLLRAFAENIHSARLYAGLATMNDEARRLVVETYTSRELLEAHPNSLLAYGSALSVREGGLLLPGGAAAAPAWESLLGARTDRPKRFVRRLFSQDNGKPLAFYHTLINLPEANQRFLTSSPERLAKFYAAFPFTGSEEAKRRIVNHRIPFRNLVRELPVDGQGRVRFPGSARVWAVSPGWSGSPDEIPNSTGLAAPAVSPEAEDEILLRLPLEE